MPAAHVTHIRHQAALREEKLRALAGLANNTKIGPKDAQKLVHRLSNASPFRRGGATAGTGACVYMLMMELWC